MIKHLVSLLALFISIATSVKSQSIEAHFFASVTSNGNQYIPESLIETIKRTESFNQSDSCIVRHQSKFITKGEYLDTVIWSTCKKNGTVTINRGNELYHQFNLSNEEHKGYLFKQKGRINVIELVDSLKNNSVLYQIKIAENPRNWIIYNPQTMQVEFEMHGNKQLRSLKGFIFEDLLRPNSFSSMVAANAKQMKKGHRLQVLFKQTNRKPGSTPITVNKHLADYQLHRIDTIDNIPYLKFSFSLTDLEFGTSLNNDTVAVGLFDEGIFIGNQLGIPYTELPLTLRRTDPSAENWINFLFPMEEILEPYVETSYHFEQALLDKSVTMFAYWNSNLPARITWPRDFPLPYREFEDYRAEVVYMKNSDAEIGQLYSLQKIASNHFSFVNETKTGIDLELSIPDKKGKFKIEVRTGNDSLLNLNKNEFNLKKGNNSISLQVPNKQPAQYYKLRLISLEGKEEKLEQEYYFISRYFN
jgi:hypothetical protein